MDYLFKVLREYLKMRRLAKALKKYKTLKAFSKAPTLEKVLIGLGLVSTGATLLAMYRHLTQGRKETNEMFWSLRNKKYYKENRELRNDNDYKTVYDMYKQCEQMQPYAEQYDEQAPINKVRYAPAFTNLMFFLVRETTQSTIIPPGIRTVSRWMIHECARTFVRIREQTDVSMELTIPKLAQDKNSAWMRALRDIPQREKLAKKGKEILDTKWSDVLTELQDHGVVREDYKQLYKILDGAADVSGLGDERTKYEAGLLLLSPKEVLETFKTSLPRNFSELKAFINELLNLVPALSDSGRADLEREALEAGAVEHAKQYQKVFDDTLDAVESGISRKFWEEGKRIGEEREQKRILKAQQKERGD